MTAPTVEEWENVISDDQERAALNRWIAENVAGFQVAPEDQWGPGDGCWFIAGTGALREFRPATDWSHAAVVERKMAELGYWMRLQSPFARGELWFAGFTPHGMTGWNGRPDHQRGAPTGPLAICLSARAAIESERPEPNRP